MNSLDSSLYSQNSLRFLGPIAVSVIIMITGETRYGILGLIPMMLLGALVLAFVKDPESEQKFHKKKIK